MFPIEYSVERPWAGWLLQQRVNEEYKFIYTDRVLVYHTKVLLDKGIIDKGIIRTKVLLDKGIVRN